MLDGTYTEYHEEVETAKGRVTLIQFRNSFAEYGLLGGSGCWGFFREGQLIGYRIGERWFIDLKSDETIAKKDARRLSHLSPKLIWFRVPEPGGCHLQCCWCLLRLSCSSTIASGFAWFLMSSLCHDFSLWTFFFVFLQDTIDQGSSFTCDDINLWQGVRTIHCEAISKWSLNFECWLLDDGPPLTLDAPCREVRRICRLEVHFSDPPRFPSDIGVSFSTQCNAPFVGWFPQSIRV